MIRRPPTPVPVEPAVAATSRRKPAVRVKPKARRPTRAVPGLADRLLASQAMRNPVAPVPPPPPNFGGNGGY